MRLVQSRACQILKRVSLPEDLFDKAVVLMLSEALAVSCDHAGTVLPTVL